MKYIDNFLNGITMYKLVLYGLQILAVISIVLGFLGKLPITTGLNLLISALVLAVVSYGTNMVFGKIFNVQLNVESSSITAFILFFVLFPLNISSLTLVSVLTFVLVPFVAMASKYVLAIHKKHVFNPVAVALFLSGILAIQTKVGVVSWWVATPVLLLPVAVLGFLILRKVRRFELFFTYFVVSLATIAITTLVKGYDFSIVLSVLKLTLLSGPIVFFGSVMLTEPLTTPPSKKLQMVYGAIVGVVSSVTFHFGILHTSPELALLVGNIFSYLVSPRARLVLKLIAKNKLSPDVFEFVFQSDRKLDHKAGQYLEWTLGHSNPDSRGNRRFFTISSSPTEENIKLGVKFYDNSSTFKKKLGSLEVGSEVVASQLAGEFTLPDDNRKKLVFIAGGIGVTPFRSMVKYLSDKGEKREVTMFYSNRTPVDIDYKDIFTEAENKIGLKTVYAVNDLAGTAPSQNMPVGFINAEMIMKEVPDYKERMYYISGPHGMVTAFEATLSKMGINKSQIKIDFFPGFV